MRPTMVGREVSISLKGLTGVLNKCQKIENFKFWVTSMLVLSTQRKPIKQRKLLFRVGGLGVVCVSKFLSKQLYIKSKVC